jgi:rare lipoprotein A
MSKSARAGSGKSAIAGSGRSAKSSKSKSAPAHRQKKHREIGVASFYGRECKGRPTASGERFDPSRLTAAHRTLPLGTCVRVTNLENGRRIVVRINDRGPYIHGRVIDLSRAAARRLGFADDGITRVRLEILKDNRGWRDPLADEAPPRVKKSARSSGDTRAKPAATRKGPLARA